eukprot:1149744-Pelagomonas_calceolata.AAC.8
MGLCCEQSAHLGNKVAGEDHSLSRGASTFTGRGGHQYADLTSHPSLHPQTVFHRNEQNKDKTTTSPLTHLMKEAGWQALTRCVWKNTRQQGCENACGYALPQTQPASTQAAHFRQSSSESDRPSVCCLHWTREKRRNKGTSGSCLRQRVHMLCRPRQYSLIYGQHPLVPGQPIEAAHLRFQ